MKSQKAQSSVEYGLIILIIALILIITACGCLFLFGIPVFLFFLISESGFLPLVPLFFI
jgi:uncharacterized protein (UPF0333 family)